MDGTALEMPPLEWGGHLVEILFDIGPCSTSGFGLVPITEMEIAAWQLNRQIRLTPWECQTLRRLSKEYVDVHYKAESPDAMAPWLDPKTLDLGKRKDVASGFKLLAQQQNAKKK